MSDKVITASNLGSGYEIDTLNHKIHVADQYHILPKLYYQNDNVNRSFTTTVADGFITNTVVIRDKFNCRYHYELPCRNDSEAWGGGYTYLYISVNGGAFVYLGHSGYQNAMVYKGRAIRTDTKTVVLRRGSHGIPATGDYKIKVKLRHRSYNGSLYVNKNRGTGTALFASYHEFQEVMIG